MTALRTRLRSIPAAPWLAVVAIYLVVAGGKVLLTMGSPVFNWEDDAGLFYTENALHYNYARMVAEGHPVPEWDQRVQHPEGLRVTEEFTVALEYASGCSYRFLTALGLDVPFHAYAVFFISFFSTLVVFPLFALARGLWGSKWAAVGVVALYAFLPAAFLRTIAGFTREDFALPFLFTAITCLILAIEDRRAWLPWLAGVTMAIGQHSWHLSPFVMTMVAVFVAIAYFRNPEQQERIARVYGILILCVFVGGLVSPVLRNKAFVVSNSMVVSYALLASHHARSRWSWSRATHILAFAASSVLLVAVISALTSRNYQAYGHAFQLVFYKILYLGRKPADPNLLTPEARSLWMSSFANAGLRQTWVYFSSVLLLAPISIGLSLKTLLSGKRRPALDLAICFSLAFLVLYLIVSRLHVFAVFFLAAMVGQLIVRAPWRRPVIAVAVTLLAAWEFGNANSLAINLLRPPGGADVDAIAWVRENTRPGDVILGEFSFTATVFTYARRPIVIHPKWDSHVVRDKVIRYKRQPFEPEEKFYQLCREWEADYFIYQASVVVDTTRESPVYEVGLSGVPRSSAAYHFHFQPDSLEHFSLRYQNLYYRIYKVDDPRPPPDNLVYNPIFDRELLDPGGVGDTLKLKGTGRLLAGMADPGFHVGLGRRLLEDERWRDARDSFSRALEMAPGYPDPLVGLVRAYAGMGDSTAAVRSALRALRTSPNLSPSTFADLTPRFALATGRALVASGAADRGARWIEHAASRMPDDPEAQTDLARLHLARGQRQEARSAFSRILALTPRYGPALKGLAVYHQSMGQMDSAAAVLRDYLALRPDDPDTASMRRFIESASAR